MPKETKQAIVWSLDQLESVDNHTLVDMVREYFNENNIEYDTFSYDDLVLHLPQ